MAKKRPDDITTSFKRTFNAAILLRAGQPRPEHSNAPTWVGSAVLLAVIVTSDGPREILSALIR